MNKKIMKKNKVFLIILLSIFVFSVSFLKYSNIFAGCGSDEPTVDEPTVDEPTADEPTAATSDDTSSGGSSSGDVAGAGGYYYCKGCFAGNVCRSAAYLNPCQNTCLTSAECEARYPTTNTATTGAGGYYYCKGCFAGNVCRSAAYIDPCRDKCQTDAECETRYTSAGTSGGRCESIDSCGVDQCRTDADCRVGDTGGTTGGGGTSGGTSGGSGTVYTPSAWTPPVSPPAPKCGIIEFSINGKTNEERDPLLVWVNASLKGRISTNTDCTKCTVESTDTWGNDPDPVEYAINFANNYNAYETFKIPESGTYSFTVTCQGSDPEDIVVDTVFLKTVQAINLPWWREIIPVLPGFLRGIFR